jgi:hypothetical protein
MDTCNTEWAAGLFEGEGCINIYPRKELEAGNLGKVLVRLTLATTDLDVLERFQEICGYGSISERKWHRDNGWKPSWRWSADAQGEVERLIMEWWPYLGSRRKRKADEAMQVLKMKRENRLKKQRENMAVARETRHV